MPQQIDYQAAYGVIILCFFIQFQLKLVVELFNGNRPFDQISRRIYFPNVRLIHIIFVFNVAHNFFHQVLNRGNSRKTAVLIDQNRHMAFGGLKLFKQLVDIFPLRHKIGRAQDLADVNLIETNLIGFAHKIPNIQNTDDVVDILFVDRNTGIFFIDQFV